MKTPESPAESTYRVDLDVNTSYLPHVIYLPVGSRTP